MPKFQNLSVLTTSSPEHNKGPEVSIFETINQASPKDERHSFGERKQESPNLKDLIGGFDGIDQLKKSYISEEGSELQLLDEFAQNLQKTNTSID